MIDLLVRVGVDELTLYHILFCCNLDLLLPSRLEFLLAYFLGLCLVGPSEGLKEG